MTTPLPRIKAAIRRDETILRLGGCGNVFPMSWAADDRVFFTVTDGAAFPGFEDKAFHSRVLTVTGDPPNLKLEDVPGYPAMPVPLNESESDSASYWGGSGCLALDGCVYQYLTTSNHPWLRPDLSFWPDFYWTGAKLIYSPDNGLTWRNHDGSAPVVREKWNGRSRENIAFFNEEPPGAFAWLSILQMGRNYELNRDGYIYVYSPNGYIDGTMNALALFRIPKERIRDRHAYEFFSGLSTAGDAKWTRDMSARAVVHTFPRGWVNRYALGETPWAWTPSVVYNAPLGVYMMASWGNGCTAQGGWFVKPSYLGLWMAPTPWGPFTQIHEELAWTPGNDLAARAHSPQIAPKWISRDGKSFWLAWSDYQYKGAEGEMLQNPDQGFMEDVKRRGITDEAEFAQMFIQWCRKHLPHSRFNLQRVDLVIE